MRQSKSTGSFTALLHSKSKAQLDPGPLRDERSWPTKKDDYDFVQPCGTGVSATVWLARERSSGAMVAVKALNLDGLMMSLDDVKREVAVMRAYRHPAILPLYTSFVCGHELFLVTPYMAGGSVAHMMRYRFKDGLEEALIATVMRDVLGALAYIHKNGGIHRDVKAGNVLVDGDGRVALGDFGVSATMERGGEWGGSGHVNRNTFVGTPCWMAPEVLEQTEYGPPADIWSFGITLLEMAHGHAPFARFPPMKVLLMTLQGPPPQLEAQCGRRHFSRAMREVVAQCLQKDPAQRPTAARLLQHRFFRHARDAGYVKRHLMEGLPPLPQRHTEIVRGGGAAATRAAENEMQAAASQALYLNDVASWDFACVVPPEPGGAGSSYASPAGSSIDQPAAAAAVEAAAAAAGAAAAAPPSPILSFETGGICARIMTPPPGAALAFTPPTAAASPAPGAAAATAHGPAAAAATVAAAAEQLRHAPDPSQAPPAGSSAAPQAAAPAPVTHRRGRFTVVDGAAPPAQSTPPVSPTRAPPQADDKAPAAAAAAAVARQWQAADTVPQEQPDQGHGTASPPQRAMVSRTRSISSPNLSIPVPLRSQLPPAWSLEPHLQQMQLEQAQLEQAQLGAKGQQGPPLPPVPQGHRLSSLAGAPSSDLVQAAAAAAAAAAPPAGAALPPRSPSVDVGAAAAVGGRDQRGGAAPEQPRQGQAGQRLQAQGEAPRINGQSGGQQPQQDGEATPEVHRQLSLHKGRFRIVTR